MVLISTLVMAIVNAIVISISNSLPINSSTNLQQDNFNFSLQLLKQLATVKENVAFSPFGLSAAIGILSLAAKGKTLSEIQDLFDVRNQNGTSSVSDYFKTIIPSLKNNTVDFATCLFTHSTCGIYPSFGREAIDVYQSDIQQLDFTATQAAAANINSWVSKQTKGKITSLVDANSLDPNTQLLITSALYFHADWKHPFDANITQEMEFETLNKTKKIVNMMRTSAEFDQAYDSETNTRILSMPYKDEEQSMVILLPRNKDGINQLLEVLSPDVLKRMLNTLTSSQVLVSLPKFKSETEYSLKDTLSKLGIHDLFSAKANLSGILCNQTLLVNNIIQKTFIEVEEKGTTAASVTEAELIPLSKPFSFDVNHPFAYFIYDQKSSSILFMGVIYDLP